MSNFVQKRVEESGIFCQQQADFLCGMLRNECLMFSTPFEGLRTSYLQQRFFRESFDLIVSI